MEDFQFNLIMLGITFIIFTLYSFDKWVSLLVVPWMLLSIISFFKYIKREGWK